MIELNSEREWIALVHVARAGLTPQYAEEGAPHRMQKADQVPAHWHRVRAISVASHDSHTTSPSSDRTPSRRTPLGGIHDDLEAQQAQQEQYAHTAQLLTNHRWATVMLEALPRFANLTALRMQGCRITDEALQLCLGTTHGDASEWGSVDAGGSLAHSATEKVRPGALPGLQVLLLGENVLASVDLVVSLLRCIGGYPSSLRYVQLRGNPRLNCYRRAVVDAFPLLLGLDDNIISDAERRDHDPAAVEIERARSVSHQPRPPPSAYRSMPTASAATTAAAGRRFAIFSKASCIRHEVVLLHWCKPQQFLQRLRSAYIRDVSAAACVQRALLRCVALSKLRSLRNDDTSFVPNAAHPEGEQTAGDNDGVVVPTDSGKSSRCIGEPSLPPPTFEDATDRVTFPEAGPGASLRPMSPLGPPGGGGDDIDGAMVDALSDYVHCQRTDHRHDAQQTPSEAADGDDGRCLHSSHAPVSAPQQTPAPDVSVDEADAERPVEEDGAISGSESARGIDAPSTPPVEAPPSHKEQAKDCSVDAIGGSGGVAPERGSNEVQAKGQHAGAAVAVQRAKQRHEDAVRRLCGLLRRPVREAVTRRRTQLLHARRSVAAPQAGRCASAIVLPGVCAEALLSSVLTNAELHCGAVVSSKPLTLQDLVGRHGWGGDEGGQHPGAHGSSSAAGLTVVHGSYPFFLRGPRTVRDPTTLALVATPAVVTCGSWIDLVTGSTSQPLQCVVLRDVSLVLRCLRRAMYHSSAFSLIPSQSAFSFVYRLEEVQQLRAAATVQRWWRRVRPSVLHQEGLAHRTVQPFRPHDASTGGTNAPSVDVALDKIRRAARLVKVPLRLAVRVVSWCTRRWLGVLARRRVAYLRVLAKASRLHKMDQSGLGGTCILTASTLLQLLSDSHEGGGTTRSMPSLIPERRAFLQQLRMSVVPASTPSSCAAANTSPAGGPTSLPYLRLAHPTQIGASMNDGAVPTHDDAALPACIIDAFSAVGRCCSSRSPATDGIHEGVQDGHRDDERMQQALGVALRGAVLQTWSRSIPDQLVSHDTDLAQPAAMAAFASRIAFIYRSVTEAEGRALGGAQAFRRRNRVRSRKGSEDVFASSSVLGGSGSWASSQPSGDPFDGIVSTVRSYSRLHPEGHLVLQHRNAAEVHLRQLALLSLTYNERDASYLCFERKAHAVQLMAVRRVERWWLRHRRHLGDAVRCGVAPRKAAPCSTAARAAKAPASRRGQQDALGASSARRPSTAPCVARPRNRRKPSSSVGDPEPTTGASDMASATFELTSSTVQLPVEGRSGSMLLVTSRPSRVALQAPPTTQRKQLTTANSQDDALLSDTAIDHLDCPSSAATNDLGAIDGAAHTVATTCNNTVTTTCNTTRTSKDDGAALPGCNRSDGVAALHQGAVGGVASAAAGSSTTPSTDRETPPVPRSSSSPSVVASTEGLDTAAVATVPPVPSFHSARVHQARTTAAPRRDDGTRPPSSARQPTAPRGVASRTNGSRRWHHHATAVVQPIAVFTPTMPLPDADVRALRSLSAVVEQPFRTASASDDAAGSNNAERDARGVEPLSSQQPPTRAELRRAAAEVARKFREREGIAMQRAEAVASEEAAASRHRVALARQHRADVKATRHFAKTVAAVPLDLASCSSGRRHRR